MNAVAQHQEGSQPVQVTTGAGIAIAGVWFAGAVVTITLLMIFFVVGDHSHDNQIKLSLWQGIVLFLILASPMIAAFKATKLILGKD